jgi:hypothetical protein
VPAPTISAKLRVSWSPSLLLQTAEVLKAGLNDLELIKHSEAVVPSTLLRVTGFDLKHSLSTNRAILTAFLQ